MSNLESILKSLENAVARDSEIERILSYHPRDHYSILQINPLDLNLNPTIQSSETHTILLQQLKKTFRRKSLLIHPDKTDNPRAPEAFARLKSAERILSVDETLKHDDDQLRADAAEKKSLVEIYDQVDRYLNLPVQTEFEHPDNVRIREKVGEYLESHSRNQQIDKEYAQREELQRQELIKSAAKERELRKSWETRWEQDRGDRVKLWRTFSSKVEKPKKKKKKVLA